MMLMTKSTRILPTLPFIRRLLSTQAKKRFYKSVNILRLPKDEYEIALDSRKLRTPLAKPFVISSEPLALAVAQEWRGQKEVINMAQMHLTGLCNLCLDNPTGASKEDVVEGILAFLDTDTLLFFSNDEEALCGRQQRDWQPLISWFNYRYELDLAPSFSLSLQIRENDREKLRKQLCSYDFNCVQGIAFATDALKSIILALALVEKRIDVQNAVQLTRLELQTQIDQWGNVEWAHDLELHDTTARVAAAALFVQCQNLKETTKSKNL